MKYLNVRLIDGWKEKLWYKMPQNSTFFPKIGSIVLVPFRSQKKHAFVCAFSQNIPQKIRGMVREILTVAALPEDKNFSEFVKKVAQFHFINSHRLYRRLLSFLNAPQKETKSVTEIDKNNDQKHIADVYLTDQQQAAVDAIIPAVKESRYCPTLLHGVTGSGKTEVYKRLIKTAIDGGKSVLFMLPEVGLCMRFYALLRDQLDVTIPIFSFHSATQTCEKRLLWKSLIEKQPCLILGVHLPILLPIANLGLIIVDEEHEGGFKEKSHPRLNSKEVAVWRAKHYQIPIVLGSATPSVSSLVRVDAGHWQRCRLQKRFAGTFPEVEVVSLREKKRRPEFWLTQQLKAAIQSRLEKKEQTIVFINRRGHSFFTQCKTCGEIFECKNCSVSLTLHKKFDCEGLLRCHYCGYASRIPQACSQCGAPAKEFLFKGIGTQRMVAILQKEFPEARIKRADLDTASKKRAWQETVDAFYKGEIDILVGTQTLTKGYHFPNVTLVGIVWGDLDLNFPSYDARESALQQLIQVAGRCGRADGKKSEVIIQTLSEDAIFKCVSEQKYEEFCKKEFAARKMCNYPPFARLIRIELRHKDGVVLAREAKTLTEALRRENSELDAGISILGPAKPPVHRVRGVEALHILLKANSFDSLHKVIGGVDLELFKALIVFEVLL